jgi:hypothetical protein
MFVDGAGTVHRLLCRRRVYVQAVVGVQEMLHYKRAFFISAHILSAAKSGGQLILAYSVNVVIR